MRYVFDLDGTICTQEKSGEYHLAKPIPEMVKKVNELYDSGDYIIIFTARGMNTYGNEYDARGAYDELTRDWLVDNGVRFHQLLFGKPAADYYVDDKAVLPQELLYDIVD